VEMGEDKMDFKNTIEDQPQMCQKRTQWTSKSQGNENDWWRHWDQGRNSSGLFETEQIL
jgi:hypothetical protein